MKCARPVLKGGGSVSGIRASEGWEREAARGSMLYLDSDALLPASKLDWEIRVKNFNIR